MAVALAAFAATISCLFLAVALLERRARRRRDRALADFLDAARTSPVRFVAMRAGERQRRRRREKKGSES